MVAIVVVIIIICAATPRIALNQISGFLWRWLVPISLLNNLARVLLARSLFF